MEKMFDSETLDSELEAYIEEVEVLGKYIRHPLVYAVPYFPQLNKQLNISLKHKKEYAKKALEDRDWSAYFTIHERPYRIEAFKDVEEEMNDQEYWGSLAWIYTDLEFHYNLREDLEFFFTYRKLNREWLMNKEELQTFQKLPELVEVYRGIGDYPESDQGMSWTTDEDMARWFASRFNDEPYLLSGQINKSDILACFNQRNEKEVIILPKTVRRIKKCLIGKKLKRVI